MISMRRISGPVGIGVVRSDDLEPAAWLGNAVKLGNKSHYVRDVLNHMAADYLVEFVVSKRIRHYSQIVDHIRMGPWV